MASAVKELSSASSLPSDNNDNEELWRSQASAWNMIFSLLPAMVLKSALRLGLPDIIARAGPGAVLSIKDIAAHLPTKTPNLDALSRILRYLSSIGIFTESIDANNGLGEYASSDIRYGLTHLGKSCFVIENNPLNLASYFLLHTHEVLTSAWNHFDDCVLEGRNAFKKRHGKDFWAFAESDGDFNQLFNTSMVAVTSVLIRDILSTYDGFKDVNTLIDLGGGVGQALRDIVAAYPHIRGINFDLPHVIATAPTLPGIQHVSGNFLEDTLPRGDAFFMKHVLHLWDDNACHDILSNCHQALPENGKIIVAEEVMDVSPQADPVESGKALDMVMLGLMSGGGRERCERQWRKLFKGSGFQLTQIIGRKGCLVKIIEAVKF
eukprot:Gb_35314 [translate_table: standard]